MTNDNEVHLGTEKDSKSIFAKLISKIAKFRKGNGWLFGIVAIIGFWTFIAALETLQIYVRFNPGPSSSFELIIDGKKVTWLQWGLVNALNWYVLAFFTPIIFYLCRRWTFDDSKGKFLAFGVHLIFSFLFSCASVAAESLFSTIILGFPVGLYSLIDLFLQRLVLDFHLMFVAYWAILGAGLALEYYRKYREREEEAAQNAIRSSELERLLVQTRLDSLKAQIHPHFLFNTLNTISSLIVKVPNTARDMIADLSDLLRFSLDSMDEQLVPIKREIEITKLYLNIERQRFTGMLKTEISIEPESYLVEVPCFILQPLVENSITHGFSEKTKLMHIDVRVKRPNDFLEIVVEDTGKGFSENFVEGIGIGNTRSRLNQLYGERFELALENRAKGGARVRLVIPIVKKKDNENGG